MTSSLPTEEDVYFTITSADDLPAEMPERIRAKVVETLAANPRCAFPVTVSTNVTYDYGIDDPEPENGPMFLMETFDLDRWILPSRDTPASS